MRAIFTEISEGVRQPVGQLAPDTCALDREPPSESDTTGGTGGL